MNELDYTFSLPTASIPPKKTRRKGLTITQLHQKLKELNGTLERRHIHWILTIKKTGNEERIILPWTIRTKQEAIKASILLIEAELPATQRTM